MGAVIINSGQSSGNQLTTGSYNANRNLTMGGQSVQNSLYSGANIIYSKIASIPDIGVKIATAADYLSSKVVTAANYFAGRILQSYRSATSTYSNNLLSDAIRNLGYAEGGVVDQPTFGIFGEAGAEALVPLDNRSAGWRILQKILPLFGIRLFADGGIVGSASSETPNSDTIVATITLQNMNNLVKNAQDRLNNLKSYFRKTWDIIRAEGVSSWRNIISELTKVYTDFVNSTSLISYQFRIIRNFYDKWKRSNILNFQNI